MSNQILRESELSGITLSPKAPTVPPKRFSLSSIERLHTGHLSERITYGATEREYTSFLQELLSPGGALHHLEDNLRFHYDPITHTLHLEGMSTYMFARYRRGVCHYSSPRSDYE